MYWRLYCTSVDFGVVQKHSQQNLEAQHYQLLSETMIFHQPYPVLLLPKPNYMQDSGCERKFPLPESCILYSPLSTPTSFPSL